MCCVPQVRDLDAESGSDPYMEFTLLDCKGTDGKPPKDATPPVRNAKHPKWAAPCTMPLPLAETPRFMIN